MVKVKKKKKLNKGVLFILPSIIGISIFILIPFLDVVLRSFQNEVSRDFVGLSNYKEVFNNNAFKLASINTLKFALICIPLLLIMSLVISVLIHRFFRKSEFLKTSFLLPMAIPIASVVLIWKIVFNNHGLINGIVNRFGVNGIDWMNTRFAFWVLVATYIWKNLGYTIILWLAGLSCISDTLYEAAKVDGASEFQCFTKITIPNLKPTLFTITVLSLLNSFKVFREAYLISGNYPHKSIYMLQHLFNNWFTQLSFGKMSAASVVVAAVTLVLILILQKSWERDKDEE